MISVAKTSANVTSQVGFVVSSGIACSFASMVRHKASLASRGLSQFVFSSKMAFYVLLKNTIRELPNWMYLLRKWEEIN